MLGLEKFLPFSSTARKPVFQGFWHGPPLGALRKACLRTFLEKGYVFELYTYDHVDAPDGVIIRRAEAVIPKADLFYYKNPETGKPDLGPFSDLFRFKLLLERGGWWIDVDTIFHLLFSCGDSSQMLMIGLIHKHNLSRHGWTRTLIHLDSMPRYHVYRTIFAKEPLPTSLPL